MSITVTEIYTMQFQISIKVQNILKPHNSLSRPNGFVRQKSYSNRFN